MFANLRNINLRMFRHQPEPHSECLKNPYGRRQPSLLGNLFLAAALIAALAGCSPSASALALLPVTGGAALTVHEYPLVEQSKDNPTHLAFQEHVRRAVQDQRQAWDFPRSEDQLQTQNMNLAPFGFHLEASATPPFSGYTLYYQGVLLRQDIARFWPVSVKNETSSQDRDFLLPFLTIDGEKLVASAAGIRPWPGRTTDNTAPIYYGSQIAYAETQGGMVSVYAGPSLLYASPDPTPEESRPSNPDARRLYTWGSGVGSERHWALEMDGQVIIDGENLNETQDYQRIFEFHIVDGQPMYFFEKDGIIHIHYAGKNLAYIYDDVVHEKSGPLQVFNPGAAGNLVWFYALRDGLWYYVEAGDLE